MVDREKEKVIKGLECCAIDGGCGACPYDSFKDCTGSHPTPETLMKDALALLKEQEPGKVNITITQSDGWKEGNCPFCGMKVDSFYNWSYCGTCGKGLEWE